MAAPIEDAHAPAALAAPADSDPDARPPDPSLLLKHPHPQSADHSLRRPPLRSNFDLEPNPFEQSFSRSSNSVLKSSDEDSSDHPSNPKPEKPSAVPPPPPGNSAVDPDASPKPTLPPLASFASPGARSYAWGLSSAGLTNHNSLRSGPLSPAMLSGPADVASTAAFDHSSFRTGLTPGTGLTPLVGGPSSFPPPSPNTAAFLAMVTGTASQGALNPVPATITPNTLSALAGNVPNGVIPTSSSRSDSIGQLPYSQASVPRHYPFDSASDAGSGAQASAASTAANGLFLLSQAHQELTKREEAQARAGSKISGNEESVGIVPSATNKRSSKRKQDDGATLKTPLPKRSKGGRKKKDETPSDSEDDESTSPTATEFMVPATSKNTKDMTDEEKRKNFLERNRQAALKCRQRKKAWLAQLQAKVEYLTTENERLTTALVSSREEISRLNTLVGAHSSAGHLGSGHLTGGNGSHVPNGPGQQPVSVAVSLGGGKGVMNGTTLPTGVTAGGSGRGYGY